MTKSAWDAFYTTKERLKTLCAEWNEKHKDELSKYFGPLPAGDYSVFNSDLDKIKESTEIKLLLLGDNPGKVEREKENLRYLAGPAGKLGKRFFSTHKDLGIKFPDDAIVLNKTPFFTPRTRDLKDLILSSSDDLKKDILSSMAIMASAASRIHKALALGSPLWITGYSEMGRGRVFFPFSNQLLKDYDGGRDPAWEWVGVFQHFSMNRFLIDYNQYKKNKSEKGVIFCNTPAALSALGKDHRVKIFGV